MFDNFLILFVKLLFLYKKSVEDLLILSNENSNEFNLLIFNVPVGKIFSGFNENEYIYTSLGVF